MWVVDVTYLSYTISPLCICFPFPYLLVSEEGAVASNHILALLCNVEDTEKFHCPQEPLLVFPSLEVPHSAKPS